MATPELAAHNLHRCTWWPQCSFCMVPLSAVLALSYPWVTRCLHFSPLLPTGWMLFEHRIVRSISISGTQRWCWSTGGPSHMLLDQQNTWIGSFWLDFCKRPQLWQGAKKWLIVKQSLKDVKLLEPARESCSCLRSQMESGTRSPQNQPGDYSRDAGIYRVITGDSQSQQE